jgi:hypothetical protein
MRVSQLIELLQEEHDPDEPIVFQFLTQEHADYTPKEFDSIADYLAQNDNYASDTSRLMREWCEEALDCLEQDGKGN